MSEAADPVSPERPGGTMDHLDEMTCLLYAERQLDRARAQAVSAHTQDCAACRTLLRALDHANRGCLRAPCWKKTNRCHRGLRSFRSARGDRFGLDLGCGSWIGSNGCLRALHGLCRAHAEQRLEQAGFGGTSLLSLLVFKVRLLEKDGNR